MRTLALILILITAVCAWAQPPPARVVVMNVIARELAPTTELIGAVDFDKSAGISTEISGLIAESHIEEGTQVKRGEVLVRLNADFVSKDMDILAQEIAQLDVKIENTRTNLKRFETLYKQAAATEKQFDDLRSQLKELLVQKKALQARRAKVALELEKSRIRAPFDGLVIERFKTVGEWIAPGVSICILASIKDVVARVAVSENLVKYVSPGQTLNVYIESLNRTFTGRVDTLVPMVDPKSKTAALKVALPYVKGLLQNMTAFVNVPSGAPRRLNLIKRDALIRSQGGEFVYTVDSGTAKMVPITIAAVEGEFLGVQGTQIEPGMQVVVDGNERLRPGQKVDVIESLSDSGN